MDIFNKKKISDLEKIIEKQEDELKEFRKERELKNSGKRKTGVWCQGCKNAIVYKERNFYGEHEGRFCLLNNECKDRET